MGTATPTYLTETELHRTNLPEVAALLDEARDMRDDAREAAESCELTQSFEAVEAVQLLVDATFEKLDRIRGPVNNTGRSQYIGRFEKIQREMVDLDEALARYRSRLPRQAYSGSFRTAKHLPIRLVPGSS